MHNLLNQAIEIAEDAGALVLKYYKKNVQVSIKDDGSRVTEADKASEALIIKALKKLTPHIPIISEESVNSSDNSLIANGNFWLVDPIDGTEGFIQGNDDFAINIGLIQNFRPLLGVIHSPVSALTYAGITKEFSFVKRDRQQLPLSSRTPDDNGLIVLLYHILPPCKEREDFLNNIKIKKKIMNSNALRFPRVAEGEVDVNPFFETCYEWDTAAGHAILLGAGGNIVTLDGLELTYAKKDFRNHSFIAHGAFSLLKTLNL